jgi:prepilin-type processing-associated H-X9-DG protein
MRSSGAKEKAVVGIRCAFGSVEVLVVLGLIGVLLGLALPAVQAARERASRMACQNNLKQIGLALHSYHDVHSRFPPEHEIQPKPTHDPETMLTWMALILPYVDESGLWQVSVQACNKDSYPCDNPPHVGYGTVVRSFVCPSDGRLFSPLQGAGQPAAGFTSYIGIGGIPGVIFGNVLLNPPVPGPLGQFIGVRLIDIRDGASQTLLAGERPPPASLQAGRWYPGNGCGFPLSGPDEKMLFPAINGLDLECAGIDHSVSSGPGQIWNACDRYHLWSLHPGGGNFVFCDGSVRYMTYAVNPLIPALSTCSGGESVSLPD